MDSEKKIRLQKHSTVGFEMLLPYLPITQTYLYNLTPLKPQFYIVKLGFTGVYIIFLFFLLKNIDCGTRLNRLVEAVLTSTHNLCFEQKYEKYQIFYLKFFISFLVVKFSLYLNRHVFVMRVRIGLDNVPLVYGSLKFSCKTNKNTR